MRTRQLLLVFALAQCLSGQGDELRDVVKTLSRQLQLQQLFVEERVRSDGCSGIKQIRINTAGERSYFSESHVLRRVAAIHDHANNMNTVGMGECVAVMNGVEFRTRHNDYKLVMPATAPSGGSIQYHAVVNIPYPEVPPSIRGTVDQQTREMREHFRAFSKQDMNMRNYKPYFKPLLCYMEGAWTLSTDNIEESFDSDRHFLDAESWNELHDKVRFAAYTGSKDSDENLAFLPTTIIGIERDVPVIAQWNYRILCHPLSRDLPTNRLKPYDDLASRMGRGWDFTDHTLSRAARFKMSSQDRARTRTRPTRYELIDELMSEIPGKDGYNAFLQDDGLDGQSTLNYNREPLNAAYYHRSFLLNKRDAMGEAYTRRGFADENLYMARTTQPNIAPIRVEKCDRQGRNCQTKEERWSYAFPLEIIYLTPLHKWNPYNIRYMGDLDKQTQRALRWRGGSASDPLPGSAQRLYYQTPALFYQSDGETGDAADTSDGVLWVTGGDGQPRQVVASGVRIHLPLIEGIDEDLRTRYPIMPVHGEGSAVWKELEAIKDLILNPERYQHILQRDADDREDDGNDLDPELPRILELEMSASDSRQVEKHTHSFMLDTVDVVDMIRGEVNELDVTAEQTLGHTHRLVIKLRGNNLVYTLCDNDTPRCWDNHPNTIMGPSRRTKLLLQQAARRTGNGRGTGNGNGSGNGNSNGSGTGTGNGNGNNNGDDRDTVEEEEQEQEEEQEDDRGGRGSGLPQFMDMKLLASTSQRTTRHQHPFRLKSRELVQLIMGTIRGLNVTTDEVAGHTHNLIIQYGNRGLVYSSCDRRRRCWDGHPAFITGPEGEQRRLLLRAMG